MSALADAIWAALRLAEAPHIDHCGDHCDGLRHRDDCCTECSTATFLREALREAGVNAFWHRKRGTVVVDEATCDRLYRLRIDFVPETDKEWERLEQVFAKRPQDAVTLTKFDDVFKEYYRAEDMIPQLGILPFPRKP